MNVGQEHQRKWQRKTGLTAVNSYQPVTDYDIVVATGYGLPAYKAALILGRTYASIVGIRQREREKAKMRGES